MSCRRAGTAGATAEQVFYPQIVTLDILIEQALYLCMHPSSLPPTSQLHNFITPHHSHCVLCSFFFQRRRTVPRQLSRSPATTLITIPPSPAPTPVENTPTLWMPPTTPIPPMAVVEARRALPRAWLQGSLVRCLREALHLWAHGSRETAGNGSVTRTAGAFSCPHMQSTAGSGIRLTL